MKHCLKLMVREFLNLSLKATEVIVVCLILFVYFKAADFPYFMGQKFLLWQRHCLKEALNLCITTLLSAAQG